MSQIAEVGHNKSPFYLTTDRIQELYDEAKNWCDGEPLTTVEQHDTLVQLVRDIRSATTKANEARKEEAKPFDDGKQEIQDRYNPFLKAKTGLSALAIETAQEILRPYLAEQDRLKKIEEQRLIDEALEKERLAIEAMESSKGDLDAREKAEEAAKDAKKAEANYRRETKTNIAKGARTVWDTDLIDATEAMRHLWPIHLPQFKELMLDIAKGKVRSGAREIPGFEIISRKVI